MRRRTAALALAVCLSGSVGACSLGTDSGRAAPPDLSLGSVQAGASPTASSSASSSATSTSPTPATGLAAELAQRASHSTATLRSARLTMSSVVGDTRMTMSGQIGYHPVRLDVTASVKASAGGSVRTVRIREILVGQTMYLRVSGLGGAKPWHSLSLRQLSQFSGIDLKSLLNNTNADPSVRMLTRSADLKLVGVETVGGVRTRHLAGTVDLDAVFAAMPASERTAVATLRDMMDQLGVADMRIELWVNSADVPVKLVQSYQTSLGPARTTMYLTHLNARTSISAPPRSQVQPFPG